MNNVTGRVILFTLAGTLAGLLTWFFSDLSGIIRLPDSVDLTPEQARMQVYVAMFFGVMIGILLGAADTLASGVKGQWPKILGIGAGIGILAGIFGISLGMAFFGWLYVTETTNPLSFVRNVIARAIGWAFIGAIAGTADGFRKWSFRVGRNGFIGGAIGGLLGGTTFEIIPYLLVGFRSPGVISRLFAFLITGAMIGLFIALVQQLLKEAWIRVVVGRNEGKEYLVEKVETKIGRAEVSDVPLFGDPNIARTHAVLVALPSGQYALRDTSGGAGLIVNGERITPDQPQIVRNGDQIQIANRLLVFHERLTKNRTAPAPRDVNRGPRPNAALSPSALPSLSDLPPAAPPNGGAGAFPSSPSSLIPHPSSLPGGGGRLIATDGPHAGAAFTLRPGATIGREPGLDVALTSDTKASRRHAQIVADGAGMAIEDLGSTNGTYVNGQRIVARQPLVPGDTVTIGTTLLRVE